MSIPPSDPVALVTGAASGIGLALSTALLSRNFKVFMADISPSGASVSTALWTQHREQILASTGSLPPDALAPVFLLTDVSSWTGQSAAFRTAWAHTQRIDFFAANAGIGDSENLFGPAALDETGELQAPNLKTLDIDLGSVVAGFKLFLFYARKSKAEGIPAPLKGGERKMIVTASMSGLYPFQVQPLYCAAKHGVVGLVRSVGKKALAEGVAVNAVLPAFVETGMPPKMLVNAVRARGHLSEMGDLVDAYMDLVEGEGMSGETVEVSRGERYWRTPVNFANASQQWLVEDPEGFLGGEKKVGE